MLWQKPDVLTTGAGVPIGDKLNEMTAGHRGPLLVQDVVFTDEMAHFDRERIPERVVHAKGAGKSCPSQEAACMLIVPFPWKMLQNKAFGSLLFTGSEIWS